MKGKEKGSIVTPDGRKRLVRAYKLPKMVGAPIPEVRSEVLRHGVPADKTLFDAVIGSARVKMKMPEIELRHRDTALLMPETISDFFRKRGAGYFFLGKNTGTEKAPHIHVMTGIANPMIVAMNAEEITLKSGNPMDVFRPTDDALLVAHTHELEEGWRSSDRAVFIDE
jgi:hypothetical protein